MKKHHFKCILPFLSLALVLTNTPTLYGTIPDTPIPILQHLSVKEEKLKGNGSESIQPRTDINEPSVKIETP